MSRVFVSCSYRDRAVGAELGSIVRALGHESADDHDDKRGTAWWNEVVGRIEASRRVRALVASPSYADAHACRLAAKHAAASGLPVVRVDLDDAVVPDCPPVVAAAVGCASTPEDPAVVDQLATGPVRSAACCSAAGAPGRPRRQAPDRVVEGGGRADRCERRLRRRFRHPAERGGAGPGRAEHPAWLGAVRQHDPRGERAATGHRARGQRDAGGSRDATDGHPGAACPGGRAAGGAGVRGQPPPAGVLVRQAGAEAVTCSNPAPNIRTVVLTPYQTPAEALRGVHRQGRERLGEAMQENTGNCSNWASEGEVGWNLDKEHSRLHRRRAADRGPRRRE